MLPPPPGDPTPSPSVPIMAIPPTPTPGASLPPPEDPTPEPTASPTPVPTPSPTPVPTPSPTPFFVADSFFDLWLRELLLNSLGLPGQADATGDAVGEDGQPSDISPDLDLIGAFGGWAMLPDAAFGPGGLFDCAKPNVLCGQQPVDLTGAQLVLIGLQGDDVIGLGRGRAGQLAVAFDQEGFDNAPLSMPAFGGSDLIVIGDLDNSRLFELVFQGNRLQSRDTPGRLLIDGDSALLVMPIPREHMPRYRVVTFERIPPTEPGAGRMDTLPEMGTQVDSFFDIFFELTLP